MFTQKHDLTGEIPYKIIGVRKDGIMNIPDPCNLPSNPTGIHDVAVMFSGRIYCVEEGEYLFWYES